MLSLLGAASLAVSCGGTPGPITVVLGAAANAVPGAASSADPSASSRGTSSSSLGRLDPLTHMFVLAGRGTDRVVAAIVRRADGDALIVDRRSPEGVVRWSVLVSPRDAYWPTVAISGADVAVAYVTGSGSDIALATFDAESGAPRISRKVYVGAPESGVVFCLAPRRGGYLLVDQDWEGSTSTVRWLRADGTPESERALPIVFFRCAIAPAGAGWLFVHTRFESEMSYVRAQPLDASGAVAGAPAELGPGFDPVVLPHRGGATLVWGDRFWNELRALELRADGRPVGTALRIVQGPQLLGFGIVPDGPCRRVIYASKMEMGDHRLCAP
jgi:hypothetical protein